MKIKNKGKVYPSPSSSSSSSDYVLSVLKLLPAAILALASVLSVEDREVLAYMITRSLKTSTTTSSSSSSVNVHDSKKKNSRKQPNDLISSSSNSHKLNPMFDCDCFDCYTSYWYRWNSSPNGELIHQVIEAFEDHLTNGEQSSSSKKTTARGKRRDKTGKRVSERSEFFGQESHVLDDVSVKKDEDSVSSVISPDDDVAPEKADDEEEEESVDDVVVMVEEEEEEKMALVVRLPPPMNSHKGLVRKVLPDFLGILNSRLWNLWSPNV